MEQSSHFTSDQDEEIQPQRNQDEAAVFTLPPEGYAAGGFTGDTTTPGEYATEVDDTFQINVINLQSQLLEMIDLDNGLLDELYSINVLSCKQQMELESTKKIFDKIGLLLDYVINMSKEKTKQFRSALDVTQQGHIVRFILLNGDRKHTPDNEWPLTCCDSVKLLQKNWAGLKDLVDAENGLLDELLSVGCINRRQKGRIERAETGEGKNDRLLSIVRQKSVGDYENFIKCLLKTQQDVAAWLLAPERTGALKPLDIKFRFNINAKWADLMTEIRTSDTSLLDELYGAECLTSRQMEHIKAASSHSVSNSRLLEIIRKLSQSKFDKFMDCLSKTGQQHVRTILDSNLGFVHQSSNGRYPVHEGEFQGASDNLRCSDEDYDTYYCSISYPWTGIYIRDDYISERLPQHLMYIA